MSISNRYQASRRLYERAQRTIPGATHLSGRPLIDPARSPSYFDRGRGSRCWDVDGNEYIDFILGYGPFLLGYAHPEVDRAACAQIERGSLLSLNAPMHVEFAEALVTRFRGAEMAVFLKTGSEATTAALRIARRATGRRKVARCGYHGWHDWCLPLEPYTPSGLSDEVLEFRATDPSSLEALFAASADIAAVIVAPEMVLPTNADVFAKLLSITHAHGTVFILDEVKTAFRTLGGSMQQSMGLVPDLTTLSKALGNGWPIAAVVGKEAIMRAAAGMHISATYHGDTAPMAAALTVLRFLDEHDVAGHVNRLGGALIAGLNEAAVRAGVPALAYGEPITAMPFLRFSHADPSVREKLSATFFEEVIARGILLHPRHMWFMSWAHTEDDVEAALAAARDAFGVVQREHASLLK